MKTCYTFDDVLLVPKFSNVLPSEVITNTNLTAEIELSIPLLSAAMDTVSEASMAITLAQHGGMGCIHRNLPLKQQVAEVHKVKKYESWIVRNPITIFADEPITSALHLMQQNNCSGIPVKDRITSKLVGILTNRDVRFINNTNTLVMDLMTAKHALITVKEGITLTQAMKLLHSNRIERLLVVDNDFNCIGLITVKDIEKFKEYPSACKDKDSCLRVAAAIGTSTDDILRAEALIDAKVDLLIIDTAHGHSSKVFDTIAYLKKQYPNVPLIGGNIATAEGAKFLIKAGVNGVKVGVGPGATCTTRVIAGVGVPQLSAIIAVHEVCKKQGITLIADGGIRYSGDIAKAIAAGADVVMLGSLFAGTVESPGEIILYKGKSYKIYRGMGSIAAMVHGSANRYFQSSKNGKLVPEGIEGRVPFKGSVVKIIYQLIGGLKAAMGYTGSTNIQALKNNTEFAQITNAALRESHPHGIHITTEAPNYVSDDYDK